jgi:OmpA-OmpF porin, OOP family
MCPSNFTGVRQLRIDASLRSLSTRALRGVALALLLAASGSSTMLAQPADSSVAPMHAPSEVMALGTIVSEIESEAPVARARPQNLGPGVNSRGTELGPVIAPDGRTLFFTRGGARGNQDIWYSHADSAGRWSTAVRMPEPLTNPYNNFVESVTPDGNTLLVGGRYLGNNSIITGLALAHRTLDGWSTPEPLRIRNYYSRSRSVSSCLGSDGGTIIMSLEREGGHGQQDLYVSFRRDGEWSEPMSLGAMVNTPDVDFAPFLAADGVTLYFASKGHGGFGDADIFVTRRLDSSWSNWSTPANLGPTINSDQWDAYYVIPASGEFVYYGSVNNAIGESDLLRVPLPKEVRPQPVALVSGRVVDSETNEPIAATIRYETLPDGIEVGTARTDPRTGNYAIALPAGRVYAFRAEAEGFLGIGDNVDFMTLDSYIEQSRDLAMVPFEAGQVIALQNLFFDFGQSALRSESFPELERLARLLEVNTTLEIEVSGHTDGVGSATANERLSDARVASVVGYLAAQGIDGARLHTSRYGESQPIAPNETDEGRRRNRRVEFRIVRR